MKRRTIAVLSTLVIGGTLAACGDGGSDGADADGTVTVGTLRAQPHLYTPYFYEDFAPDDLDVEIVLFDTSTDIANAVVSGSVDFGVTGAPSVLSGVSADQDIQIVASSADGGTRIVASPEIEEAEDLIGTSVGYPMGASQEILLMLTLENHGVDVENDIELVNLPFSDMAGAYESGQIQAFGSAELGPSIAIEEGAQELLDPYETSVGRTNIVLATTGELADDNPDLVQAVVDTHIEASDFMNDNPDEWAQGVVEEFGLEEDVVETSLDNIWPRWELDEEYQETVNALVDEILAFDQLDNDVDRDTIFNTSFVD